MTWLTVLQILVIVVITSFIQLVILGVWVNFRKRLIEVQAQAQVYVSTQQAAAQTAVLAAESYRSQLESQEAAWQVYMENWLFTAEESTPATREEQLGYIREARIVFENMYPYIGDPMRNIGTQS